MRIKISFYESANYTSENAENNIKYNDQTKGYVFNQDKLNEIGNVLKDILIEDYFNCADKAVIYIGFSIDNEEFEFDLMSNC